MTDFAVIFISWLTNILYAALIGRVILSWINVSPSNPISIFIFQVTEPILAPIRRLLPKMGTLDLSPMIAILLITVIKSFILGYL
ncbi:MAG: YggT family protein [Chloroflexi bacterium]|nr:YggT family protein [Chloroflexota bacterium]